MSTDALKLIAVGETRPDARLILAFADQAAADSVSGWKAAVLNRNKVEKMVVEVSDEDRALIVAAQERQRMVNAPAEDI